ncbi:MAG TPA: bifunctional precorrin-2 dehydrogenase/sirohydrochlorin ferrochelatase [Polyangiaceae bacterium]|jgi:siroheme synthase-like protein
MQDFIVALRVAGRRCLVIGDGTEASRRVESLLERGAVVTWLKRTPESDVVASERLSVQVRAFDAADLEGVWLAVLTDRDRDLARRVAGFAEARCIWFCAVDQPELTSFAHVALASAGLVQVAVGTGGAVPALARRLREEIERLLSESGLGPFAEALARLRESLSPKERRERLGPLLERVRLSGRLELPEIPQQPLGRED